MQTEKRQRFIEKQRVILQAKLVKYEAWIKKDAGTQSDLSLRVVQKQKVSIPHIQEALMAIENGTYGICRECGKLIPYKRLMAVPGATRCITCQDEEEA